jgi:hypothetical protein
MALTMQRDEPIVHTICYQAECGDEGQYRQNIVLEVRLIRSGFD